MEGRYMEYLSVKEYGDRWGFKAQTIRKMIKDGRLSAVMIGRYPRIPDDAVPDKGRVDTKAPVVDEIEQLERQKRILLLKNDIAVLEKGAVTKADIEKFNLDKLELDTLLKGVIRAYKQGGAKRINKGLAEAINSLIDYASKHIIPEKTSMFAEPEDY